MIYMDIFVVRLKELRIENNLLQKQVAQAIGTNETTIVRWESGQSEPSAYYIAKLAKFFHVSADYLLGLEDDLGQKSFVDIQETLSSEELKVIAAYRNLSSSSRDMILRMLNID